MDVSKWITLSIMAAIIFVVLTRPKGVDQAFKSLAALFTSSIGTLQGREVTVGGARVGGLA